MDSPSPIPKPIGTTAVENSVEAVESPEVLIEPLRALAEASRLLVASDFDGTLAPITAQPGSARLASAAAVALRDLAAQPHTTVAIISGRGLADLRSRCNEIPNAILVGSYGSECSETTVDELSEVARTRLQRVTEYLHSIADGTPNFLVEAKPLAAALHYRGAHPRDIYQAINRIALDSANWDEVHVRFGTQVVELGIVSASKGEALRQIRSRCDATAALFVGDDDTDEEAFAVLGETDLGVRIGPGPSLATARLPDVAAVAEMLTLLARLRATTIADPDADV